jgi:hypothetical protein
MFSKNIGAITTLLKECPMAVRCSCSNCALNIDDSYLSKVVSVRNTISILK